MEKIHDTFDPDDMPEWLQSLWPKSQSVDIVAGVNDDDCAVIKINGNYIIITTDFLNSSPICTELGIGNLHTLGRLTVASNLSDLCSTGAKPKSFLIAVTMPKNCCIDDFKQLMLGVKKECKKYGIPVIGGDTKLGSSLAIIGTAIGTAEHKSQLFLKNQASPGQLLWASGFLGSCSAAVLGLTNIELTSDLKKWAISCLTIPKIPLTKSRGLSESKIGRAGIDISDGLGEDVYRLCKSSKVGVKINASSIPVAPKARKIAKLLDIPVWTLPFGSGGDFQFIVTTPKKYKDKMKKFGFYLIGETTENPERTLVLSENHQINLPIIGHRDSRNLTFAEEIYSITKEIANVKPNRNP